MFLTLWDGAALDGDLVRALEDNGVHHGVSGWRGEGGRNGFGWIGAMS